MKNFEKTENIKKLEKIFDELEDYKDSNSKVCECDYQK